MEVNYQKILKKVIKDYGNNLDDIIEFIEKVNSENNIKIAIPFKDIVNNKEWTVDEKVKLLRYFGYQEEQQYLTYEEDKNGKVENKQVIAEYYTIKFNDIISFEALMKIFNDVERETSKDKVYKDIFRYICEVYAGEKRLEFLEVFFKYITKEDMERLLKTKYYASSLDSLNDTSIMIDIIASQEIELIKKYIDYVDVNTYFNYAVATGNIEIVRLFLDKGADVNYVPEEVILGVLSPLKIAISNNNLEMLKYLVTNGAKVDLQIIDEDFYTKLCYYKTTIYGGWSLLNQSQGNENPRNKVDEKKLRDIRIFTPLEFATKLNDYQTFNNSGSHKVYFEGARKDSDNFLNIDRHNDKSKDALNNRNDIVNYLVDSIPDKTSIHYEELLLFSFITNDVTSFNKYVQLMIDNNYVINSKIYDLMKYFFIFNMADNKDMTNAFIDFLGKCSNNDDIYIHFFNEYLKYLKQINCYCNYFKMTDFARILLNKIDIDKRKELIIIPYCHDLHSVNELAKLGFDINQVNEKGENILISLMHRNRDLQEDEVELFDILLDCVNLTHKDNDGKTALYYAMINFPTSREYMYEKKLGNISRMEACVVELIKRMPKEEVCNEDIMEILNERTGYSGNYGDNINNLYVWQHHKDLYSALIKKGLVLSDIVLKDIFDSIYSDNEKEMENIKSRISYDETLDFVYGKLDYNTDMQIVPIKEMYEELLASLENDISYEFFRSELINFGISINVLKQFYNDKLLKKYNPKKYMEYIETTTGTIYEGLDEMMLNLIIRTLVKFGSEKLPNILSYVPAVNLNTIIRNENVGLNYWNYVEMVSDIVGVDEAANPIYGEEHFEAGNVYPDYDDNIKFTGGLMQYAVLTDNVSMAELLLSKGVGFYFLDGNEDRTWDYVNSKSMLELMENTLGYKKEDAFNPDEYSLYLKFKNNKKDN